MKDLSLLKVFVYGTLKPGEFNYQRYCSGKVINANRAIAQGQLFNLPAGYPAMVLGEGWVHGFVLSFGDPNVLRELDAYEDYQVGRSPDQNLYERYRIETCASTGQPLGSAWAYLMSLEKTYRLGGRLLPDGYWCKSDFTSFF